MAKLEDILKSQGYTDQDLEAIKPLLSDARFRSSIEGPLANLETERDVFKGEAEKWQTWRETEAIPKIDEYARQAFDARTKLAASEAQVKIAKEWGYAPKDPVEDPAVVAAREAAARAQGQQNNPPANFDAKQFLGRDEAYQFAKQQATAMAQFTNLSEEYRVLNPGKSLFEYEGQNGLHGIEALLQESVDAKVPLKQYVANKFNFQSRRDEISAAQKKAAEDAIRADERAKLAAELGNPALRSAMPSRQPMIPPRPKDGGMPWDHTSNELRERRLQNAYKTQSQVQ